MNKIIISKASLQDLATIQQIGRETFLETFAEANTEADMEKYLAENFSDEKMNSELSNPDSQFFIAWDDKIPVGYLKVNSGLAQTELKDPSSLEIERIYVKKAYHGQMVGQILYEKSLEVAQLQNPKAIRFYEKNGFKVFDKHIFKFGEDEQTDIMMKKVL
jgi:GNAT superfamily N-acetyltransferase